ncbi:MAG TPA: amidohydrolase family protein [Terriglobales bacterium]|nr:amidohydrolase family protein [Terriglobales bacterium]
MRKLVVAFLLLLPTLTLAQLSPEVKAFVTADAPVVALTHARVIDGTGAAPKDDQTIVITNGHIQSVGDAAKVAVPSDAKVLDLHGYTVIPGLVGMHDHLFYPAGGGWFTEMGFSFPRLYLAGGVTTIRTTGSLETYTDLEIKKQIDSGKAPGPKIGVTGPYLEGEGSFAVQMHALTGPEDARKTVAFWAEQGATSYKAYMFITRAELGAAIEEAHRRGIKVTGHLCSVTFREAAALGIDDLEHGLLVDTAFVPDKKPDACPPTGPAVMQLAQKIEINGPEVQQTIRELVAHHVAVTSTLPVFEMFLPDRPSLQQRVLDALSPDARATFLANKVRVGDPAFLRQRYGTETSPWPALLKKEMQFERAFAQAGGLLLAGEDPTGIGGVLAGFGDQREVELLVEAGFTPVEAIRVASFNGAQFMGEADRIGSIAPGKQADLLVIRGDPAANISDIEKVETVFKDGIGYDSAKLINSVRGLVGLR